MAKRCGPTRPCGMSQGIFNPFFQNGKPWYGTGGAGVVNSELSDVVSRAAALGYTTPNTTLLQAIDDYITDEKESGGWSLDDIRYIFALNNTSLSQFSTLNYRAPSSHQILNVNMPVYGVRGWTGDGVSAYLDTNFNPATAGVNYTQNSASRTLYVTVVQSVGTRIDGVITTNPLNSMSLANSTAHRINSGGNDLNSPFSFAGLGYKAMDRSDSTNVKCYVGATPSARTQTSAAITSQNQTILKTGTLYSNATVAMYTMGASLSEAQHSARVTNFANFLTSIGL